VKKRVLITLAAVLGLLVVAVVGLLVWVNQGGLDRLFERQLRADLEDMNVRLEVDRTELGVGLRRHGTVLLENMKLYAGDDAEPFAEIGELRAQFDIRNIWQRHIDIKELRLVRPRVVVRFDEQGRTNLDAIKLPETRAETSEQLTYLMASVFIQDGEVQYGDARRSVNGTVDNLEVSFVPTTGNDNQILHRLEGKFSNSRLEIDNRALANIGAEVKADVTREGARVETLTVTSPAGDATFSGRITNWRELQYELDAGLTVALDQVAAIADPASGLGGSVAVNGKVSGTGAKYTFDGALTADDVFASGLRASGLRVDGLLTGEQRAFSWNGQLLTARLAGRGLDASNIRFDGRAEGEGADVTVVGDAAVGRFSGQGVSASDVRLRGRAEASGEEVTATGDVTIARVAGREFTASGLRLSGRAGTARGATASGDVALDALNVRTVRVGNVRGKVSATEDRVDVNNFTAVVYGGGVTGSATVRLAGGGASSLIADFKGINLDQAAGAASADAPRVQGTASGRVALTWPGSNVQAATGTVRASVDGNVQAEGGALPLEGEVALTAVPGRFRIDRAEITSDGTRIAATGSVGWNRTADVTVTAESPDASNLTNLLGAFNPGVAQQIASSGVALGGEFRFEGQITGPLADPTVQGRVDVGDIAYGAGEERVSLGAFSAEIDRAGGRLRLENGRLRQSDGSEIAFNFDLPGRGGDSRTISARLDRVAVGPLLRAPPLGDLLPFSGGVVSGTIDLRLPASGEEATGDNPELTFFQTRGTVDLTITGAVFRGEPLEEVRIRADLGEGRVALSNVRVVSARGVFTLTGSYIRKESSYQATITAENVDLTLIEAAAAARGAAGLSVAGRADGTITLAGSAEQLISDLKGDIVGRNVTVNGEQIGDPRIAISTANGLTTVRASAELLGETRTLVGTVNVNSAELPFELGVELDATNFVQYARLVAPVPPGVSGRATGRVTVTGFLGDLAEEGGLAARTAVSGTLTELALAVAVDTTGRRYELANRGDIVVTATPGSIRFERATFTGDGTELTLAGDLGLAPGATSNLSLTGDVNLALASSFSQDVFAAGIATVQATVTGTSDSPRFSGFASVRDASLRVADTPVSLYNGQGRILFNSNQALIESFTAQSGGGSVRVGGGVLFAGLRPDRWRFDLTADQVRATYPQDVRSVIDGQLVLQGNRQLQVLSGVVNVRRAEYTEDVDLNDLISLGRDGSFAGTGPRGGGPASPLRLDVRVEARDALVIRNNLADAVASASLVLTGPINDPIIDGRATVTRGTIEFRSGEWQVTRGVVRFPGRQNGDITFDLQAESDIQGYRVTLGFTGTPDRFYPTFRSEPALPQSQILSLVLTGDVGSDEPLTTEAITDTGIGLAGSLLGEAVSRSVQKRTDRLFGINRFRIDPLLTGGSDPSARLTVGRQINENLVLTYSTNITSTQESVVQLEYRVSDRISIVAAREDDGSFGIDVRLRKRF
jgi:translocation and assembly module TamB